jgi:hypothetical protein
VPELPIIHYVTVGFELSAWMGLCTASMGLFTASVGLSKALLGLFTAFNN